MDGSDQLQSTAALTSVDGPSPVIRSLVFPKACLILKRKNLFPYQKSNHDPSVIQSVA
jgi:hypothetical protein